MISWCTILGGLCSKKTFYWLLQGKEKPQNILWNPHLLWQILVPRFSQRDDENRIGSYPRNRPKKHSSIINLYPVLFHAHPQTPNSGCEVIVKSILYKSHVSNAAQPRLLNVRGGGEFVQRHFGSRHQTSHLAKLTTHLKAGPRDQLEENMEKWHFEKSPMKWRLK